MIHLATTRDQRTIVPQRVETARDRFKHCKRPWNRPRAAIAFGNAVSIFRRKNCPTLKEPDRQSRQALHDR
jgi:hypothetical protein